MSLGDLVIIRVFIVASVLMISNITLSSDKFVVNVGR